MPAGKPWSPIRGKRMRLTRLTNTAAPDTTGTAAMGCSAGFVVVKITPNYDDGERIQLKTADNRFGINEPGERVLLNAAADIQFVGVDPDLFTLITGQPAVVDAAGKGVGMRLSGGAPITNGFALEVWTGIAGNSAAMGDGGSAWGYFLLPFLHGGKVSEFSIENGAASFSLSTESRENPAWGTGPYDVVDTSVVEGTVTPGPLLESIDPLDHVHMQYTTIAPPAAIDGLAAIAA